MSWEGIENFIYGWGPGTERPSPKSDAARNADPRAAELGAAIRDLRWKKGWTQAELAQAAEMAQPAVARLESGRRMPTIPVLARLANALDAELVVQLVPRT